MMTFVCLQNPCLKSPCPFVRRLGLKLFLKRPRFWAEQRYAKPVSSANIFFGVVVSSPGRQMAVGSKG